jgi:hypothetical protein
MKNVILSIDEDGFMKELYPGEELLPEDKLHELAVKHVPNGDPFILACTADLPENLELRRSRCYKCDFSEPDGYGEAVRPFRKEDENATDNA